MQTRPWRTLEPKEALEARVVITDGVWTAKVAQQSLRICCPLTRGVRGGGHRAAGSQAGHQSPVSREGGASLETAERVSRWLALSLSVVIDVAWCAVGGGTEKL